ncbi:phage baseplate assembly protein [Acidomonas methanolica]|uniref:phage baseplate assembly protein n=1 Tax=Acidomonas methanolica TaxID=437 RepID=UPI001C04A1EC|nr:phage baseplate assembly protein [Acidomonas methanolica]
MVHVFANGGDPSDLVALVAHNPSVARLGDLAEGETVLYDRLGQAVYLKAGAIVQVDAAQQMVVRVAGQPVLTVTASGVQVQGTITATEDVVAGQISLQSHVHGNVQQGGDLTGKPQD